MAIAQISKIHVFRLKQYSAHGIDIQFTRKSTLSLELRKCNFFGYINLLILQKHYNFTFAQISKIHVFRLKRYSAYAIDIQF